MGIVPLFCILGYLIHLFCSSITEKTFLGKEQCSLFTVMLSAFRFLSIFDNLPPFFSFSNIHVLFSECFVSGSKGKVFAL